LSKHIIVLDESIIIGTFSEKEINKLYPVFVNEVLRKLKDIIAEKDINPQITIYIRDGRIFKYYIGLETGFLLTNEESNKIINSLLEIFGEVGFKIDHVRYEKSELGRKYLSTIPINNLITLNLKENRELNESIEKLDNTLHLINDLLKYTLYGEISLVYDLINREYYIWINLGLKPDLEPLRKLLDLILRYRNQGLRIDIRFPEIEKPISDLEILMFMLYYSNYVFERLMHSNALPVTKRNKYVIEYLNFIRDLISYNRIFPRISEVLSKSEGLDPSSYVELLRKISLITDVLSPEQYEYLVKGLNAGLPRILRKIAKEPSIDIIKLLNELVSTVNIIYYSSSKYRIEHFSEEYEAYQKTTSTLTKLYGEIISALYNVIMKVEPKDLIEYINRQRDIHHVVSTLIAHKMLSDCEKFVTIEPAKLVKALEKLLFDTYYYKIELKAPEVLTKLKISDKLLVKEYGNVFNGIDVYTHDKKYLNLLLKYYADELPTEFREKALNVIYNDTRNELIKALNENNYDEMIEILKNSPKIISDKAIKEIVWPRLNNHINKLLSKNADKALEFTTNMLNKLKWTGRDEPLYTLKTKLQGKKLSIIRRYKAKPD